MDVLYERWRKGNDHTIKRNGVGSDEPCNDFQGYYLAVNLILILMSYKTKMTTQNVGTKEPVRHELE